VGPAEMERVAAALVPTLLQWERELKAIQGRDPTLEDLQGTRHPLVIEWLLMNREIQRTFTSGDPRGLPGTPSATQRPAS
jgi:hypothetical protein